MAQTGGKFFSSFIFKKPGIADPGLAWCFSVRTQFSSKWGFHFQGYLIALVARAPAITSNSLPAGGYCLSGKNTVIFILLKALMGVAYSFYSLIPLLEHRHMTTFNSKRSWKTNTA